MVTELPAVYAVYDHPEDHPDAYVIRRWVGETCDEHFCVLGAELMELRGMLQDMGLTRLERDAEDDPVILETWL